MPYSECSGKPLQRWQSDLREQASASHLTTDKNGKIAQNHKLFNAGE
jgi:hypothetical protein